MDITRESAELQKGADALLEESGLISLLERYGQVTIGGSCGYHLMTVPDIDLYLTSPDAGREHAKDIICDLIGGGFWRGYALEDFDKFPRDDFPRGIYIGLKGWFHDRFWKVDIWNLIEISADVVSLNSAMSLLTGEQRRVILEIKGWRDANARQVTSKIIYDAVLGGDVLNLESFKRLINEADFI